MFGKSNKPSPIDSLIGAGTTIEGDIAFTGGLRIDGHVKGSVKATATKPGTLVVSELANDEGDDEVKLRVLVAGGGCSGLQYGFTFDEVANEDDAVMQKNGVSVLIDPMSYQYLIGAEIDYTEGLEGAQFVIKNPNATSTCGCGSSFTA